MAFLFKAISGSGEGQGRDTFRVGAALPFTLFLVFALSAGWEFALKDIVTPFFTGVYEDASPHIQWKHVFTATGIAGVAFVISLLVMEFFGLRDAVGRGGIRAAIFLLFTLFLVFALSAGWEFALEDSIMPYLVSDYRSESLQSHWKYMIACTSITGVALAVSLLVTGFLGAHEEERSERIRTRILLPFALLLVFVVGAFILTAYRDTEREHKKGLFESVQRVENMFYRELKKDADLMQAALKTITRNEEIKAAYLARDREALYRIVRPLFEDLQKGYGITHFYFTGADRVNFLRVHKPDRHGDVIGRLTTRQAEETGEAAAGVELGPLGTLTLRVVAPWRDGSRVIGFVELGHEVWHFAEEMNQLLGVDLLLLVYKRNLDREGWGEGMRLMGHLEEDWDRYPTIVTIDWTMERLPAGVIKMLEKPRHPHMPHVTEFIESRPGEDEKTLIVTFLPIFETTGREVGDFAIVRDVTGVHTTFRQSIAMTVALSLLAGGVVFVLFYVILGRVEGDVRRRAKELSDEIAERKRTEKEARRNLTNREIISSIQRISLRTVSLDEILDQTLDVVLSSHGLDFEPAGAIFLVDNDTGELVMRAHKGPDEHLLETCVRLPLGRCLCGRAAQTGELVFTSKIDDRHEIGYPGMKPHGHYCAPIKSGGQVLGVLNLYVPEGHQRSEAEDRLVTMTADALAGVIRRTKAEENLRKLSTAVEQSPASVIITDTHGTIEYVNPKFVELTGYTREEAIGQNTRILKSGDQPPEKYKELWETISSGKVWRGEFHNRKKNGEDYWESASISPIKSPDGAITHFLAVKEDITEKKRAEALTTRLGRIIEQSVNEVYVFDEKTLRFITVNRGARENLGYSMEELKELTPLDLKPEFTAKSFRKLIKPLRDGKEEQVAFETVHKRKDGSTYDVDVRLQLMRTETPPVFVAIIQDITERKKAEESMRLAATVFETAAEAIMVTDADAKILAINQAFTEVTGYEPEEIIGKTPDILNSGLHDEKFFHSMWESLRKTGKWQGEILNRRKTGELFVEWQSVTAIKDADGKITQYVAVFSDITKRKEAEEVIRRQANYDALTDLPNRNLFLDRLTGALTRARRNKSFVALMFLDLDRFKWVNDTLGHAAGDQLLRESARRLTDCIRESDTVSRLSGDEFTVILPDLDRVTDTEVVAQKILDRLSNVFILDGQEVFISGSIGITIFPSDGTDVETLLKNADSAMYSAKDGGRNAFRFFTREMQSAANERLILANDLRRAMDQQEFFTHYQPIVEIATGRTIGCEALMRWNHPLRGTVPPDKFIPLAEETGLIVPMGEWILRDACRQTKAWIDSGLKESLTSVNMSSRQFMLGDCCESVSRVLEETGLPPDHLVLEITESLLMEEERIYADRLNSLRDMGIHIALDDFGTGYSSLSYLKRFPVDILKIDRSFVLDMTIDPEDAALVEAIIAMARNLKLKVVAEGVETLEQVKFLSSRDCECGQGHYYCKPIPPEDYAVFASERLVG